MQNPHLKNVYSAQNGLFLHRLRVQSKMREMIIPECYKGKVSKITKDNSS